MTQDRYHRQMLLPEIGEAGQKQLARSHVLLVGCGALGCTIADLLVRAGVGMLTIVDRDVVELTNLQRQSLFDERDVAEGLPKAVAAQRKLSRVNSAVRIGALVVDFTAANAELIADGGMAGDEGVRDEAAWDEEGRQGLGPGGSLGESSSAPGHAPQLPRPTSPAQVIIDGTDNFETRYLMNDLAVKRRLDYIYGGAVGTRGMQMTVRPGAKVQNGERWPCLRCIFEQPPAPGASQTCDTAGILGPVATIVAAHEAGDAIKILAGCAERLSPSLLEFDLWTGQQRRLDLSRMARPDCPCCIGRQFEFLDAISDSTGSATMLCGRDSVQVMPPQRRHAGGGQPIDLEALAMKLRPHGSFVANRYLLRGEFDAEKGAGGASALSMTVFSDGRVIVHGTTDAARARSIYARYIGS